MSKAINLLFPVLLTFLLVMEAGNYIENPSDPDYEFPLIFYALMACLFSWIQWNTNKEFERVMGIAERLIILVNFYKNKEEESE